MRLICPNCGAQYEVAENLIPPAGRDVQCSACGHTWFETPGASVAGESGLAAPPAPAARPPAAARAEEPPPPEQAAAAPPAARDDAPDAAEMEWEPEEEEEEERAEDSGPAAPIAATAAAAAGAGNRTAAEDLPSPGPAPARARREPAAPAPPADSPAATAAAIAAAAGVTPRRPLPPDVASILREEAAREEAARRAAARPTIEVQPELGLDSQVDPQIRRAEEARRRMARLRGERAPPTTAPVSTAPAPLSRAGQLPDIEELNSSLRPAEEAAAAPAPRLAEDAQRAKGFRLGFATVLIIAAIAALTYVYRPQLIAALPRAEGVLTAYGDAVDDLRLSLDLWLQSLLGEAPEGAAAPVRTDAPPPAAQTEAPAAPPPQDDAPGDSAPAIGGN